MSMTVNETLTTQSRSSAQVKFHDKPHFYWTKELHRAIASHEHAAIISPSRHTQRDDMKPQVCLYATSEASGCFAIPGAWRI